MMKILVLGSWEVKREEGRSKGKHGREEVSKEEIQEKGGMGGRKEGEKIRV